MLEGIIYTGAYKDIKIIKNFFKILYKNNKNKFYLNLTLLIEIFGFYFYCFYKIFNILF